MTDKFDLWIVIAALGLGSFGMRFVFLGLVKDKPLPDWMTRHLRYTAVAILPALVTPLAVWPDSTGGVVDPARLLAACIAIGTGYFTKSVFWGMGAGGAVFIGMGFIL